MAEIPIERKQRGGNGWKWLLVLLLVVAIGAAAWIFLGDRIVPVRGEPAAERTPAAEPYTTPTTAVPAPARDTAAERADPDGAPIPR